MSIKALIREQLDENAVDLARLVELLEAGDMSWKQRAACQDTHPDMFYPKRGNNSYRAKEVCVSCPVRMDCLAAGILEDDGIWGGFANNARTRIRARLRPLWSPPKKVRHGAASTYKHLGCRCEPCRQANTEYRRVTG